MINVNLPRSELLRLRYIELLLLRIRLLDEQLRQLERARMRP